MAKVTDADRELAERIETACCVDGWLNIKDSSDLIAQYRERIVQETRESELDARKIMDGRFKAVGTKWEYERNRADKAIELIQEVITRLYVAKLQDTAALIGEKFRALGGRDAS